MITIVIAIMEIGIKHFLHWLEVTCKSLLKYSSMHTYLHACMQDMTISQNRMENGLANGLAQFH